MSDATYAAVEDALRAHVADELADAPILTDWHITCAGAGDDAERTGYLHVSSHSPAHALVGLVVRFAAMRLELDDEDDE